jgi:hypothetical protein
MWYPDADAKLGCNRCNEAEQQRRQQDTEADIPHDFLPACVIIRGAWVLHGFIRVSICHFTKNGAGEQ